MLSSTSCKLKNWFVLSVRISSYDARGKFGQHEKNVRVAGGAAERSQSLSWSQKTQAVLFLAVTRIACKVSSTPKLISSFERVTGSLFFKMSIILAYFLFILIFKRSISIGIERKNHLEIFETSRLNSTGTFSRSEAEVVESRTWARTML